MHISDVIFDGVFDGISPVIFRVSIISRQKLCVFVSVVPFQVVKIANILTLG